MKCYRIAIIRQKYRPDGGGERFVSQILVALSKRNLELNLITRNWKKECQKNWNIHICNPIAWSRISREKGFANAARTLWKTKNFDIVQSHERIVDCNIYRAGDGVHRRWLIQRSQILPRWKWKILMHDRYHRYIMDTEQKIYHSSELKAVICNAEMIKREIIEDFSIEEKKIHVIYNSVDSSYFIPANSMYRIALRRRLEIPLYATIFCFVGSNFERKGLSTAIKAIAGTPVHLVIIGRDKTQNRYQSLANSLGCQKQVRFFGMQKKILPFYQLSDALLLPTLYDPFPNAILEAMACGLPVITSNSCGGAEFIEQEYNGFFCYALDTKRLREAIMSIPSLYKDNKMGRAARNKVKELTYEKLSDQLDSLYRNILY